MKTKEKEKEKSLPLFCQWFKKLRRKKKVCSQMKLNELLGKTYE